jgi:hypothetical protein
MGPASAPFVYQEKDFPSIMGSGPTRSRNYKEDTVEGNFNDLSACLKSARIMGIV